MVAINDNRPQEIVGFKPIKREDSKVTKDCIAETVAVHAHLNNMKDSLVEMVDSDFPTRKNSMIITFETMKKIITIFRQFIENDKKVNKTMKDEWKKVSEKQSENHQDSYNNACGNKKWILIGQLITFSPQLAQLSSSKGIPQAIGQALNCVGERTPVVGEYLIAGSTFLTSNEAVTGGIKWLEKYSSQGSSAANAWAQSLTTAEQYKLGIKDSLYQQEVQTHSSDYQNGSQQQTSDGQILDNAIDTAKQMTRIHGEILMAKAG